MTSYLAEIEKLQAERKEEKRRIAELEDALRELVTDNLRSLDEVPQVGQRTAPRVKRVCVMIPWRTVQKHQELLKGLSDGRPNDP